MNSKASKSRDNTRPDRLWIQIAPRITGKADSLDYIQPKYINHQNKDQSWRRATQAPHIAGSLWCIRETSVLSYQENRTNQLLYNITFNYSLTDI